MAADLEQHLVTACLVAEAAMRMDPARPHLADADLNQGGIPAFFHGTRRLLDGIARFAAPLTLLHGALPPMFLVAGVADRLVLLRVPASTGAEDAPGTPPHTVVVPLRTRGRKRPRTEVARTCRACGMCFYQDPDLVTRCCAACILKGNFPPPRGEDDSSDESLDHAQGTRVEYTCTRCPRRFMQSPKMSGRKCWPCRRDTHPSRNRYKRLRTTDITHAEIVQGGETE